MDRLAKLLLFSSSCIGFAGEMFSPFYAVFAEEIGGDLLTAGVAYAFFWITGGVFLYIMSRVERKDKHLSKYIFWGYLIQSIGFLAMVFVKEPLHLFMVEMLFGIGAAITAPAHDGLFSELFKEDFVGGWGTWETVTYITMGIASAIGGYLSQYFGFRSLLLIIFVISLVGTAISYKVMNEQKTSLIKIEQDNNKGKQNRKRRKRVRTKVS